MRSLLVFMSVGMLSTLFTTKAHAEGEYEFFWRTSRDALVHWSSDTVRIPVDPELVAYYGDGIKDALDQASEQWSVSPNIPLIQFDFAPTAQDKKLALDKRGNWLGLARTWDYGDELAITVSTSDAVSGNVLATQVWINARRPLAVLPTGNAGFYDLQGVLTHEMGHVLGLGEGPDHTRATMNPNFKRGETHQRTVDVIDETAVTELYDRVGSEHASSNASCSMWLAGSKTHGARLAWGSVLALCGLIRLGRRGRPV
jgi:hypothetical protein